MTEKRIKAPSHLRPVSPHQIAQVRAKITALVKQQLPRAHEVVLGTREWTPTQANVFKTMLSKVVPDVSATYSQVDMSVKDTRELTREDLERIAAGLDEVDDAVILDNDEPPAKSAT